MPNTSNNNNWKEHPWTKQASNIIEGLDNFPAHSKIIIILRHSQRYEPKLINENDLKGANMELTPLGEEVAKKFAEEKNLGAKGQPFEGLSEEEIKKGEVSEEKK